MRRFLSERVDYDERLHAVYHDASALDAEAVDAWTDLFGRYLDRGARLVDIGSGTGRWSRLLAERLDAVVVGIEPSAAMRAEAERRSPHPRVAYRDGHAENLPVDDAAFDGALLSRVLHHIGDLDAAAREAARVVHPGGLCVIAAVFGDRLNDDSPLYRFWPGLRRIDRERFVPLHDTLVAFGAAGFADVGLEPVINRIDGSLRAYRERAAMHGLSKFEYLTDEDFEEGLAAIDAAAATDDGPVYDRMEVLVLQRRGLSPEAKSVDAFFRPGTVVTVRGFFRDATIADDIPTVVDAKPMVVVRDDDHHTELWFPAGTRTRRPIGLVPRRPRPWCRADSVVVPGVWEWCNALVIQVADQWRTTWVLWSRGGDVMGWLVDLDRPLRRDTAGFVVDGLQLDLVVDADRRWRWKDTHELDRAVELGFVTELDATRARREGEAAIADIEAGRWPYTDEWITWQPDPSWPPPQLRDDWWRVP